MIDKDGNMIITHLIYGSFKGVSANYSTNNGLTWSQQVIISTQSTGICDKDFSCTDDVPTSPFYGRCYCAWFHGNREYIVYTTNGGANWSAQLQINQFNSFGIDLVRGPRARFMHHGFPETANMDSGLH